MPRKRLVGEIISNKAQKTLLVKVERLKMHPRYKKRYRVFKKYMVHTENEKNFKVGDRVLIEETRPFSKRKRWRVIKKL